MGMVGICLSFLGISVRSQLQYRGAVAMQSVGHLLVTGVEFLGLWALFERFGSLQGWTLAEVSVFYGAVNVAFALADAAGRGFDTVPELVRSGDFDRLLLRPLPTALQVAGRELTLKRVGRLLQGAAVLAWGAHHAGVDWGPGALALLGWALVGAACFFMGLLVIQATVAFWTVETLELMNTLTYGGVETAQYPMSIYRDGFRRFFTVIIPLACVTYHPIAALLGRGAEAGWGAWWGVVGPGVGLVFLAAALAFWRFGEGHYTSTG